MCASVCAGQACVLGAVAFFSGMRSPLFFLSILATYCKPFETFSCRILHACNKGEGPMSAQAAMWPEPEVADAFSPLSPRLPGNRVVVGPGRWDSCVTTEPVRSQLDFPLDGCLQSQ